MKASPFVDAAAGRLDPLKFRSGAVTATGAPRAQVSLAALTTLWFNTGTLCNLACASCYIESSPTNDALAYLGLDSLARYLDEIADQQLPTREIGFTGGEPFMNRAIIDMLSLCLARGFDVLVLTNAMQPMRRFEQPLLALAHRDRLTLRVSFDHYTASVHDAERGKGAWARALDGVMWLVSHGFRVAVAGRQLPGETLEQARAGYARFFAEYAVPLHAEDPTALVLFPTMDSEADVPEITTACWDILKLSPSKLMCASSRMVVHRRGELAARVAACTLLPYDLQFDLGTTLADAARPVALNHPHCARFCVLGGASCS